MYMHTIIQGTPYRLANQNPICSERLTSQCLFLAEKQLQQEQYDSMGHDTSSLHVITSIPSVSLTICWY